MRDSTKQVTPLQARCQQMLDMEAVFRAGVTGKPIERKSGDRWYLVADYETPDFGKTYTYRVRPEPKYRPFNRHEAFDIVGKQIQPNKGCGSNRIIKTLGRCAGEDCVWTDVETWLSFSQLLNGYTFVDGTRCGVAECECG